MFTWILIAIAIAFIFGVIKVEQIKSAANKYGPQARELLNKAKTVVEEKAAEIKKNNETNNTQATVENKTAKSAEAKKAESSENQEQ